MTRFIEHVAEFPLGIDDDDTRVEMEAKRDHLLQQRQQLASQYSQTSAKAFRQRVISLAVEAGLEPILTVSQRAVAGNYYYCFLILGTVALKQINSDSTFCYSLLMQWPLPPSCTAVGELAAKKAILGL